MKINSVQFDGAGDPETITVTMTVVEAAQIACVFGEFSSAKFAERGWVQTNIYNDLSILFKDIGMRAWRARSNENAVQ